MQRLLLPWRLFGFVSPCRSLSDTRRGVGGGVSRFGRREEGEGGGSGWRREEGEPSRGGGAAVVVWWPEQGRGGASAEGERNRGGGSRLEEERERECVREREGRPGGVCLKVVISIWPFLFIVITIC